MKFFKFGLLFFSLVWKICLIQIMMVVIVLGVLVLVYGDCSVVYIDWNLSQILVDVIQVYDDVLCVDWVVVNVVSCDCLVGFWFVVVDEQGWCLIYGIVLLVYWLLVQQFQYIEFIDVCICICGDEFVVWVMVGEYGDDCVYVMMGGMLQYGLWWQMLVVMCYFGGWIVGLLIVIMLVVVFWVIYCLLCGVNCVVVQVVVIQVIECGIGLDMCVVLVEIYLLVDVFNVVVWWIGESYDVQDCFLVGVVYELCMLIVILVMCIVNLFVGVECVCLQLDLSWLGNIIEQLLDLQCLDYYVSQLQWVDLVVLIGDVVGDVVLLVVDVGYVFLVDVLLKLVWVCGDLYVLYCVVVSLVQNVIVYGGGCGIIEIVLDFVVELCVSDDGFGVLLVECELIFELFYWLCFSGSGSGLGLYLVCEIVYCYGGIIVVVEVVIGGVWFCMWLLLDSVLL